MSQEFEYGNENVLGLEEEGAKTEAEVEAWAEAETEVAAEVEVEAGVETELEAEVTDASVDEATAIPTSFGTVTDRLSEIAELMEDTSMPLDDALDMLEEAVALGMQASSLLESDMNARDALDEAEENVLAAEDIADEDALAAESVSDRTLEDTSNEF